MCAKRRDLQNQRVKNTSPKKSYQTVGFYIQMGQIFGIFPVCGSSGSTVENLNFSWVSLVTIYSSLNILSIYLIALLYFMENFRIEFDFWTYLLSVIFYAVTGTMVLFFLKLAMDWPSLMKKWDTVDISMISYGWPPFFDVRCKLVATVLFSASLVETLLAKVPQLIQSFKCRNESGDNGVFEYLISVILYNPVFFYTEYATWKGIILMTLNTTSTFAWSYGDGFIMIIGIALSLRFQQISQRLKIFLKKKVCNIEQWRRVREDYQRLALLTKTIDDAIGNIICLCFANNLMFIIFQLFNSLRYRKNLIDKIYFFFSFGFLLTRSACVCLYSSWVNNESKEPVYILTNVSSECYNVEISRLIDQLRYDCICLSGKKVFYIKKGLILSMASAVVTYELIFFQLNAHVLEETNILNASVSSC